VVIDWTCVYDDGARPFVPELAGEQRRPLSLVQNEDTTIRVQLVNPAREPIDLGDVSTNTLELKLRLANNVTVTKRATKGQGTGAYVIAIAAADTKNLERQHATFDLAAIKGAGRAAVIPTSELSLGR
jgi:hypothetical protein